LKKLFEVLYNSTRKLKARRLKIMSEVLAVDMATRMLETLKALEIEILEQEVRLEDIRLRKKPMTMEEMRQKD
jgi:hypothetical protein